MTNSTVLIADMAVLVGIFLLGLLAKLFPRKTENIHSNGHRSFVGNSGRDQGSGIKDQVDSH
jgi:hypothetical protein